MGADSWISLLGYLYIEEPLETYALFVQYLSNSST